MTATHSKIDPAMDRLSVPAQRPPLWSENCIVNWHDPASELSMFTHWSRMHSDPELWEGIIILYQPDGTLLVSRSFGTRGTADSADSGCCSLTCDEPMQRWRVRFDGMARRTTTASLAAGPLTDGAVERLQLDVAFEAITPPWFASGHEMEAMQWGEMHLQQGGRCTGTVSIEGAETTIDTLGARDHSRGPRDFSPLETETWMSGFFPSGRCFMGLTVTQIGMGGLAQGFVVQDGQSYEASSVELPGLQSATGLPDRCAAVITSELGTMHITAAVGQAAPFLLAKPNGIPLGITPDDPAAIVCVEAPTQLNWNGEQGWGWLERCNLVANFTPELSA